MSAETAASWDTEYASGRYRDEPPVPFVADILAAASARQLRHGLYIGCGNGRNLLPMIDAGLDLVGLDISTEAITQLRERRPERADRLLVGDLAVLPPDARYDIVIGIQVFQHGTRAEAHRFVRAAADRVAPGGLFCVRVNATASDIAHDHDRTEVGEGGDFTVRYRTGPKVGLAIHFFTDTELTHLLSGFTEVVAPSLHSTPHVPPGQGQWSQWEAIWQRPAARGAGSGGSQHRGA